MTPTLAENAPPPLEKDALDALIKVQRVVRRIVKALPGPFERPSQIQHCLKIDPKVAWHLFKLANAKDPLAAAPHVPGRLLMRRIGEAAMRQGVPANIIESAQRSIEAFEQVVKTHASTRTAFKAIVAKMAGDESAESLALQQRHTAFNMNSHLWGEQLDLHFKQVVFIRDSDESTTTCTLTVKIGLQHLRADASSVLEGYLRSDDPSLQVQSLEPEAVDQYGTSVIPAFCTRPVPQFKIEHRADGWRYSIVQNRSIGRRGAVDLAFGRRIRHDPISQLENGRSIVIHGTRFISPTAVAIDEMLVHRPSFPGAKPQCAIFGDQTFTSMERLVDFGRRLPNIGTLRSLGDASLATASPHEHFPRYDELQRYVFAKLGFNREEFDVYRVQMNYPILHTTSAVWFEI